MRHKYLFGIIPIVLLISFALVIGMDKKVEAVSSTVSIQARTSEATTTLSYIATTSASTTLIAKVDGSDSASLQICATASSSAAVLNYSVWFSMEDGVMGQVPTWYQQTNSAISGGTATISLLENSQSLATTTRNFICTDHLISPIGARQMMIKYGVTVANAGVYMQIVPKTQR